MTVTAPEATLYRSGSATTRVARLREKVLAMDDASVFLERTALCAEAWQEHQW